MTQHVAHRKSDEIHELRAEVERLTAELALERVVAAEAIERLTARGAEVERLRAEIEQLRAINKDVGIALDIAAAQTKPDLRALLPELAVIAQVVKERKPKPD